MFCVFVYLVAWCNAIIESPFRPSLTDYYKTKRTESGPRHSSELGLGPPNFAMDGRHCCRALSFHRIGGNAWGVRSQSCRNVYIGKRWWISTSSRGVWQKHGQDPAESLIRRSICGAIALVRPSEPKGKHFRTLAVTRCSVMSTCRKF